MMPPHQAKPPESRATLSRLMEGEVVSETEAIHLYLDPAAPLRETADELRRHQAGEDVTYRVRTSLFLTNLSEMRPSLYRHGKQPGEDGIRVLGIDELEASLELARIRQATGVFIYGAFWGDLRLPGLEAPTLLKTYGKLLEHITDRYPELIISGFSPDEIEYLAVLNGRSHRYLLEYLQDRGLKTLGGHGAEVLVDSTRQAVCPKKMPVVDWLALASLAADLGLLLAPTLEYGLAEQPADRARHLLKIRTWAERHPGAIERFIPQPVPKAAVQLDASTLPSLADRLRTLAFCRLLLGSVIPRIQTAWLPGGEEEARDGLFWGASDLGGTDAAAYAEFLGGVFRPGPAAARDLEGLIRDTGGLARKI